MSLGKAFVDGVRRSVKVDTIEWKGVAEVRRDTVLGVEDDGLRRRCGQANTTECGEAEHALPLPF